MCSVTIWPLIWKVVKTFVSQIVDSASVQISSYLPMEKGLWHYNAVHLGRPAPAVPSLVGQGEKHVFPIRGLISCKEHFKDEQIETILMMIKITFLIIKQSTHRAPFIQNTQQLKLPLHIICIFFVLCIPQLLFLSIHLWRYHSGALGRKRHSWYFNPGVAIRKSFCYSFLIGSAVWHGPLRLCLWLSNLFTFVLMNK